VNELSILHKLQEERAGGKKNQGIRFRKETKIWPCRNLHSDEEERIVNGKEGTKACPPKPPLRFLDSDVLPVWVLS
jgi:hypothetical protein